MYIYIYVSLFAKKKPHYTETQAKRLKTLQEKDIEAHQTGPTGQKTAAAFGSFLPRWSEAQKLGDSLGCALLKALIAAKAGGFGRQGQ